MKFEYLNLKENFFRSLIVSFLITGLPFLIEKNMLSALSTFIILFLGCFIGNSIFDIFRTYKELKGGEKHGKKG